MDLMSKFEFQANGTNHTVEIQNGEVTIYATKWNSIDCITLSLEAFDAVKKIVSTHRELSRLTKGG